MLRTLVAIAVLTASLFGQQRTTLPDVVDMHYLHSTKPTNCRTWVDFSSLTSLRFAVESPFDKDSLWVLLIEGIPVVVKTIPKNADWNHTYTFVYMPYQLRWQQYVSFKATWIVVSPTMDIAYANGYEWWYPYP